jgi:nucleoside-diphosphate-sugar epimerase
VRIFLTGGSGYVGAAALEALVRGGHQVDALVRNSEKAAEVQARGGNPVFGDLREPASYASIAAIADGAIHAATEHSPHGPELDLQTIETLATAVRGSGRFLIYTSGVWVIGPSPAPAAEDVPVNPFDVVAWRPSHERTVLDAGGADLRTVVVRPGIVYGSSRGIVSDLFKEAANGLIRIVGNGENRWPLVYDRDLGDLYLKLAGAPAASGIYHANDEGNERVIDIVAAIARQAPTEPSVRHVPLAEARQKIGAVADALAADQVVRSPRARALGWQPSLRSVAGNAPRLAEEWRRGTAKKTANADR